MSVTANQKTVRIASFSHTDCFLNTQKIWEGKDTKIELSTVEAGWQTAQWVLEKESAGQYKIRNRGLSNNQYLNIRYNQDGQIYSLGVDPYPTDDPDRAAYFKWEIWVYNYGFNVICTISNLNALAGAGNSLQKLHITAGNGVLSNAFYPDDDLEVGKQPMKSGASEEFKNRYLKIVNGWILSTYDNVVNPNFDLRAKTSTNARMYTGDPGLLD